MSEIIHINTCRRCKKALGKPTEIAYRGEVVAKVNCCDECFDRTNNELESVRPIFDTMLECGVSRELANETMTFLLERHFQEPTCQNPM